MKTLYIVRHAKSSWDEVGIKDSDRPLNKKGIEDAYHKSLILSTNKVSIDLLITSPAFRALNTAIIVAKHVRYPLNEIVLNQDVYEGGVYKMFDIIKNINNRISSAMLVGHNPELTNLSNHLTQAKIEHIPTSGLVCIEFNSADWKKADKGIVKYTDFSKS